MDLGDVPLDFVKDGWRVGQKEGTRYTRKDREGDARYSPQQTRLDDNSHFPRQRTEKGWWKVKLEMSLLI